MCWYKENEQDRNHLGPDNPKQKNNSQRVLIANKRPSKKMLCSAAAVNNHHINFEATAVPQSQQQGSASRPLNEPPRSPPQPSSQENQPLMKNEAGYPAQNIVLQHTVRK